MSEENFLNEIEKQLKEKDIVMVILPKVKYSEKIIDVLKIVAEHNKSICYVSANKPEKTLVNLFDVNNIDLKKFLIIDCVTGSVAKKEEKDMATVFISSPRNLTGLSIAVTEALDLGIGNVFVDALSTFMVYEKGLVVIRFAHSLISKIRASSSKGVFIVLKDDVSSVLLDDLSMFVDEVVEI